MTAVRGASRIAPRAPRLAWVGGLATVVLVIALGTQARAETAPVEVLVLRAPEGDPLAAQVETLLLAELRTGGFAVTVRPLSPGGDPRGALEAPTQGAPPAAVIAVAFAADGAVVAELWFRSRASGEVTVRPVKSDPRGGTDAAADLALRAVELLRGSLLSIPAGAPPQAPVPAAAPPEAEVARPRAAAPVERVHFLEGLGVWAGPAFLAPFTGGAGASFSPAARLSYGGRGGLAFRLSLLGPSSAREVEAGDGTTTFGRARVHRELALLDLSFTFRAGARLQPFLALGGGVLRVRADGTGTSSTFPDGSGAALGAAFTAGAGVALRLGAHVALFLELAFLEVTPQTRVLIAEQVAVTVGGPAALVSAGLGASF